VPSEKLPISCVLIGPTSIVSDRNKIITQNLRITVMCDRFDICESRNEKMFGVTPPRTEEAGWDGQVSSVENRMFNRRMERIGFCDGRWQGYQVLR
jgi:hypothetical protein